MHSYGASKIIGLMNIQQFVNLGWTRLFDIREQERLRIT